MNPWLLIVSLFSVSVAHAGHTVLTHRADEQVRAEAPGPAFVTPKSVLPKLTAQPIKAKAEPKTVVTAIR